MLVGQSIPLIYRIALGTLSVLILIGLYTMLAHSRQTRKQNETAKKLPPVQQQLADVKKRLRTTSPDADERKQLTTEKEQLLERISSIEKQIVEAQDRAVPTWKTLGIALGYVWKHDGLNGKPQYWLWEDTIATSSRLLAGLAVGVALSIILGVMMGAYSPVEAFFLPSLSFLAKIPPTAMLAVFFVLVGTEFDMYVTMIAFGTLPTLAQSIYQSAKKDVPESLVFKAYTLGASHGELIWNVIFKQILPRVIDAVRLQIGPAMVLLVAAEWMVAGEGFGYRLRLFYQRTDMSVVYLYLILLGAAGLLIDYALTWFRRLLCPWFGE
ncbi:MAG: ABC transporter permease subunit [Pirellulaceae bacterium]|nr:ABC transporter permease subunit [Pirellulaceae bacterium]